MSERVARGRVKFWKAEKSWGGIESDETPGDVWVHFSNIEGDGYRELVQDEEVEFGYERAQQDSWRYRAIPGDLGPPSPALREPAGATASPGSGYPKR